MGLLNKILNTLITDTLKSDAYERWKLKHIARLPIESYKLPKYDRIWLMQAFAQSALLKEYNEADKKLKELKATGIGDGVNPGDQKALYMLARSVNAKHILEIGTHIGGSTVPLALALLKNASSGNDAVALDTVDIRDCNNPQTQPWKKFGAASSPAELVRSVHAEDIVRFWVKDSVQFLSETTAKFDFIFLDGAHRSDIVYQEIACALKTLVPGGIIMLHDYFPDNQPLWKGGELIPGTYLGVARVMQENPDIDVLPLGSLPWQTKLSSNVTSLAMLVKRI